MYNVLYEYMDVIVKLQHNEYSKVIPLCIDDYPNISFVYAIINNQIKGEIWVDSYERPSSSLIVTSSNFIPYCYILGRVNKELFNKYNMVLKNKHDIKLVFPDYDKIINLDEFDYKAEKRLQLYLQDTRRNKVGASNIIEKYLLTHINRSMIYKCNWGNLILSLYDDSINYLNHGFGICLLYSNKVVCEAHGIIGGKFIEVGTVTNSDYRGQGLSTYVCHLFIKLCLDRNLVPLWTCNHDNIASFKVANNVGFEKQESYNFLVRK